jgi:hypothetical protein
LLSLKKKKKQHRKGPFKACRKIWISTDIWGGMLKSGLHKSGIAGSLALMFFMVMLKLGRVISRQGRIA